MMTTFISAPIPAPPPTAFDSTYIGRSPSHRPPPPESHAYISQNPPHRRRYCEWKTQTPAPFAWPKSIREPAHRDDIRACCTELRYAYPILFPLRPNPCRLPLLHQLDVYHIRIATHLTILHIPLLTSGRYIHRNHNLLPATGANIRSLIRRPSTFDFPPFPHHLISFENTFSKTQSSSPPPHAVFPCGCTARPSEIGY